MTNIVDSVSKKMSKTGYACILTNIGPKDTKVKVRSPDEDTEYFNIVAGVLQGDTLAPYLFIICLDYVLRASIDKIREIGFELKKKRSRRYPAKTITDADYADGTKRNQVRLKKV